MKVNVTKHIHGSSKIAIIDSDGPLLGDTRAALDLMTEVKHVYGCDKMILPRAALADGFFDLKTHLAGEVLQKYVNCHMKLAIVGDLEDQASKSLRDFMRESNGGSQFFFLPTEELAVTRLHGVS